MTFSTSLCIKPFSSRRFQHNDPSSPKVGCFGQVRLRKATEMATATPLLPPPSLLQIFKFCIKTPFHKAIKKPSQTKLKKPAKRGRRVMAVEDFEAAVAVAVAVAVAEMDPPLPVVMVGKKEISLWDRRCRSRKLDEIFLCRREKLPVVIAGKVV